MDNTTVKDGKSKQAQRVEKTKKDERLGATLKTFQVDGTKY